MTIIMFANYGHPLPFAIQRQSSLMARGDKLSSFTFRRRQCLQSLHAFKRRQCPHLHFKDNNVFNHCMPSKGDNVLIYISKMTMSSIIACLQKATMSSSTFRRWQCLQSLHACGSNDFQDYFDDAKELRVKQVPKNQESKSFKNQVLKNQDSRTIKIQEQSKSRFKNQKKTQSR